METLFLKHYHTTEFYTALLNHPKSNTNKDKEQQWLAAAIASAMSKGIKILPPSRKSGWNWKMTGDKEISMGFSGINGVGDIAYSELMTLIKNANKTFEKITPAEFFTLPFSKFNKSAFEASVKSGMFDDWSNSREHLKDLKQKKKKKVAANQYSIFAPEEFEFDHQLDSSKFPSTEENIKRAEFLEVCNFDIDKIEKIQTIKKHLEEKAKRPIESIVNFENNDWYFFVLEDYKILMTEKQKQYLQLKVGDGISTTSLRAFSPFSTEIQPQLDRGCVYVSQFEKNDKGFINFKHKAKFKKVT
jgi:DNA polymerase III alpha subunit